ncbi:hypothetical protein RCH10_002963 [Variovorax sp. GrIS 2.14]
MSPSWVLMTPSTDVVWIVSLQPARNSRASLAKALPG